MSRAILVEHLNDEVALLTLNRPEVLNALTLQVGKQLRLALDEIAEDSSCRVVILTGAGRGFCSGHDLAEMDSGERDDRSSVQSDLLTQEMFSGLTLRVRSMRQPVIAAVNGPAVGGGLALALAADTRICSVSARFGAAFVGVGLSGCDMGVSYLLPRTVGVTLAFEMMMSGRLVDADEALRSGLVLRVTEDEVLVEAALEIADSIRRNSPFGVTMTKGVMWSNLEAGSLEAAMRVEDSVQVLCTRTRDHREAVEAFMERRSGRFTNT